MSRSDHNGPIESEFFAELQSRLLVEPGEPLTRLQVSQTARLASVTRTERRGQIGRAALVALSLATLISTSGVAVAGSLPAPVQGMVADVARLLPVPLPIPYPMAPATTVPADPAAPESDSLTPTQPADETSVENEAGPTDESSQSSPESSDATTENTGSPLGSDDRNQSSQDDPDRDDDRDRDWDGDRHEDEDRDEDDDRDRDGGWDDDDERDRDEDRDRDDDRDRDRDDEERDRDRDEDRDRDGENRDFRKENDRSERDDR